MSTSRIGIVISSTRPTRIGHKVADWIAAQAPEHVEVEIVDLRDVDLPFLAEPKQPSQGDYELETTRAWSRRIQEFDGLVMAVAEYNGGAPAVLKNAIDSLYAEWEGLPIGLVGYGWGAGARAVAGLEPVLGTVKAERIVGPGLKFTEHLSPEGKMLDGAPADEVRELFTQVVDRIRVNA